MRYYACKFTGQSTYLNLTTLFTVHLHAQLHLYSGANAQLSAQLNKHPIEIKLMQTEGLHLEAHPPNCM